MTAATLDRPAASPRVPVVGSAGIVVTGMGVVSAAGSSMAALQDSLEERRHCLRPISGFDAQGMTMRLAGEVADFNPLAGPPLPRARTLDRGTQMALEAARQALEQAGLHGAALDDIGVAIGVSGGAQYQNMHVPVDGRMPVSRASAVYSSRATPNFQADALARAFGLGGPRLAFGSASLGGLLAVMHAVDLLRSGHAPAMVVGGGEVHALMNALGMEAMGMPAEGACTPFARSDDGSDAGGIAFGEGAACFVLEPAESAAARGAVVLGELVAASASADAYGDLAQDPSGSGLARAIEQCLAKAGVAPAQVGWVRACGTGHRVLDLAEAMALRASFGAACPPVTSTEPYFGHVNGVSPLLGLAAVLASHVAGRAPAMPEPTALRPGLGLKPLQPGPLGDGDCLVTATAFGGSNGALLVRRPGAAVQDVKARAEETRAEAAAAEPVVIAGIGAVSTHGRGAAALLRALELPPPPHGADGVRRVDDAGLPATVAGASLRGRERVARMAAVAVAEALADAGLQPRPAARIGLLVGLTRGPMSAYERFFERVLQGRFDVQTGRSLLRMARFSVASGLAHDFGLRAYSGAIACGVHGGVHLLAHGAQVLRSTPELDGLLVVAADEWSTLLGGMYERLGLLAHPPRGLAGGGCLGGEGAAAVLLRRHDAAAPVRGWAVVEGTGFAGDTGVEPDPAGRRYGRALGMALRMARRTPPQLGLAVGQACGWARHDGRERAALAGVAAHLQPASVLAHTGLAECAGGLFGAMAAAAALRDGRRFHGWPAPAAGDGSTTALLMGSTERGAHAAVVLGSLQAQ